MLFDAIVERTEKDMRGRKTFLTPQSFARGQTPRKKALPANAGRAFASV